MHIHHTTKWLHHGHLQPAIRRMSSASSYASRNRSGTRYLNLATDRHGMPAFSISPATVETYRLAMLYQRTTSRRMHYTEYGIEIYGMSEKTRQHKQVQEIAPLRPLPTPCAVAHTIQDKPSCGSTAATQEPRGAVKLGTQKAAGMVPVDALRQAHRRESTTRATASSLKVTRTKSYLATTQTDAPLRASRGAQDSTGAASTPIEPGAGRHNQKKMF